jgi:ankyrin repeat protein
MEGMNIRFVFYNLTMTIAFALILISLVVIVDKTDNASMSILMNKETQPVKNELRKDIVMNNNSLETIPDRNKYFTAIEKGDISTVRDQLENRIDINLKGTHNETGIIKATDRNNFEMVKLFIDLGADVNISSDQIDNTPIMIASVKGYVDIVRLLIENSNPDMTILNGYGGTALIPASEKGHVDVVRLLLEKSYVDVDHINKPGWTALLEAIILSNGGKTQQEIVKLLLAHGANKNIADKDNVTPIEHAKKMGYTEIVHILS